ncbi:MAG: class II glutamine amidotransferase [Solirubrobacterales bacterium]
MCELLGMSFNRPVSPALSIRGFGHRGLGNPDGWGIAHYSGDTLRLIKEPFSAENSNLTEFVWDQPGMNSRIYVAHVRTASCGSAAYRNTHPFYQRNQDQDWVFAHIGNLKQFQAQLPLAEYRPIGETDSEWSFCYLMDRIKAHGARWDEEGCCWLCDQFRFINGLGEFNCLLSDGSYLFAYHGYYRHGTKLWALNSAVDARPEHGFVIANRPLTDEKWEEFERGELKVFREGELVFSSQEQYPREHRSISPSAPK